MTKSELSPEFRLAASESEEFSVNLFEFSSNIQKYKTRIFNYYSHHPSSFEESLFLLTMSLKPSNSSENSMLLPVSDPPKVQTDDKLFKGSAMTKRGAYAAISYMSCAGN